MARFLQVLFICFQKLTKSYLTIIARPTHVIAISPNTRQTKQKLKTAILIQGPVVTENDFTLETIKLYLKNFPGSTVILSTWEDTPEEYLFKIRQEKVVVLTNKLPSLPYRLYTINLQIITSLAGLKKAREIGAKYVLKTRSDQRLYGTELFGFFLSLLRHFPIKTGLGQKKRFIVPSLYTFKYRLYSVTDMTIFGEINDMIAYFSPSLDDREINDYSYLSRLTNLMEISKCRVGEMYLSTEYLKRIGRKLKWTLKDSWTVYRDHFIVLDQNVFDIYWPKYNSWQEYRHPQYLRLSNKSELHFKDWFELYTSFDSIKIPEKTLNQGFDELLLVT